MARKQARDISESKTLNAKRIFTDREEPQASFKKRLAQVNIREYSILHFYGVGGIGKTSLQKHLQKEHLDKNKDAIYSWIDFEKADNQQEHNAYRIIVNKFKERFNITFTSFNIAYIIYLKKSNPNIEISKESLPFVEEGGILASALDIVDNIGGLASLSVDLIKYVGEKVKENHFNSNIRSELTKLEELEADKIEERLIDFLTYDIKVFKEMNPSKKIVIFLDTYESLWGEERKESSILTKDIWIRDNLVTQLKNVLFVICGREKLRWEEDDYSWIEKDKEGFSDLEQHIIGNLSDNDARYFLDSCTIEDSSIQDTIIKNSDGVPYYLDLSVDTFIQMKKKNLVPNEKDFQNIEKHKIFERFMRYIDKEKATLKLLAIANFYNKELFKLTVKKFDTAYPVTELSIFNNFSFIREDNENFYIHNLMRKSLINCLDEDLKKEVNEFYFEYYNSKLEDLDIKNITAEQEEAFKEAFYHKSKLKDINSLSKWFYKKYSIFFEAGRYNLLIESSESLLDKIIKIFGLIDSNTFLIQNSLGILYFSLGKYKECLPFYLQAFLIAQELYQNKENNDELIIKLAAINNNLAIVYDELGELEYAIHFYNDSLSIYKSFSKESLEIAGIYNNLGLLSLKLESFDNALSFSMQALEININILGEKHLNCAQSYFNLSLVYSALKFFEKSIPLLIKALEIFDENFGENHHKTANCYISLAHVYLDLNNSKEALPLFEKSLVIYRNHYEDSHPTIISIYQGLIKCYIIIAQLEKAISWNNKLLEITIKIFSEESFESIREYDNISILYENLGDYKMAFKTYERLLKIKEKKLGKDHSEVIESKKILKIIESKINKPTL